MSNVIVLSERYRQSPKAWLIAGVFGLVILACCPAMLAQDESKVASVFPDDSFRIVPTKCSAAPLAERAPIIVVGFTGGFIKWYDTAHGEVQFAIRLHREYPLGMHVEVFENHQGKRALQQIMRLLDANHDGVLVPAEKRGANIILYGHSWGGSQTVALARQLERESIPVLLTIQVDSVTKRGQRDDSIPANVTEAANFYQTNGLLHGRRRIHAVDPAATRIIGNFQFDYRLNHVACDRYSWFARAFMKPHIEIENDPRVWDEVDSLIRSELASEKLCDKIVERAER
jgi:hypothetical protein